jgi:hypothetical protein
MYPTANTLAAPVDEMDEQQATQDIVSLSNTAEEKERKAFMQDINKFMSEIGKPLSKIPIMGYKELDLFQLFKEVVAYGGFNEVRFKSFAERLMGSTGGEECGNLE